MALTDYFHTLRHGRLANATASPAPCAPLAQELADFWRQQLHGAPALLELITDCP